MSSTGKKGLQDRPSDKVTYSEPVIVVTTNDGEVGTPNDTDTLVNDGSKSTLINIDDSITDDIEQKKGVYDPYDGTLIDTDAVVETHMKSNVQSDDDSNNNRDDDNINTICGLCRKGGSQKQRLYRWIIAIAVFVIASGAIGAVVASMKPASKTVVDTVTRGGDATEGKTIMCPCEELYDSYGNPYGTFTGSELFSSYTITIFYNETGIYDEYPSLSCPLAKGNIDVIRNGYMRYFPTTDSANCIPGGTTSLQHDGISNKFTYEWTDGTTNDTGVVTFECESTC